MDLIVYPLTETVTALGTPLVNVAEQFTLDVLRPGVTVLAPPDGSP